MLALAYLGRRLWALLGEARRGAACCQTVAVAAIDGGRPAGRRTIVQGLSGPVEGRLLAIGGRLLAVIASAQGVWVSQSGAGGRFGPARLLSDPTDEIDAIAAATTAVQAGAVAWTQQPSFYAPGPATVWLARGGARRPPRRPRRPILSLAAGEQLDELALTGRGRGLTAAWVQSWFGSSGTFHSAVYAADLEGRVRPRLLSAPGEQAAGVALASAPGGAEVVAFQSCAESGACSAEAALRPAHGAFGPARVLGAAAAGQFPAVAESDSGRALVAFVGAGGEILAAAPRAGARRLGAPRVLSRGDSGADLVVGFSGRQGLVAWTQGAARERLAVARLTLAGG